MQRDMNFKAVSALREELIELSSRFYRFVNKISAVEESATKVEYELAKLQQKLKGIISGNGSGFAHEMKSLYTESGISTPNGGSLPSVNGSSEFTSPPLNFYEDIVDFFNLFMSMGKRYGDLAKKINSIDNTALNIDLALTRVQERLKGLLHRISLSFNETGIIPVSPINRNTPPLIMEPLIRAAESGIDFLGMKPFANGKAEFEIEGKRLILSPHLTKLLTVLSKDVGSSEDNLVGWKSFKVFVQLVYGPDTGTFPEDTNDRKKLQRAINQSIYLLRKSFSKAGLNPFLIQTNPQLGYRFALKRRHEPPTQNPVD